MEALLTTGGRGMTPERARGRRRRRACVSASVSIDGLEATHDRQRGVDRLARRGARGDAAPARRRRRRCRRTRRSTGSACPSCPRCSRRSSRTARTAGRSSSRSRWAAPPTSPSGCSSRTICSSCSRCSSGSPRAAARPTCCCGRATTSATSVRTRRRCAGRMPRGHTSGAAPACGGSASRPTARSRAVRRWRPASWAGGNVRDARLVDIWERAAPMRYTRDRTVDDAVGLLPRLLLRGRSAAAAARGRRSRCSASRATTRCCHHRALELRTRRQARAARPGRAGAPGLPFDQGRFELIVEDA